jgi:hypothetical protein
VPSQGSEDMKTKTRFVKITSTKDFEHLGLRKTKTAIYRELTLHISKLGTEYSHIHVHAGPRGGLRGYIAEYPNGKGAYIRVAKYTFWKKSKMIPFKDGIATQTASPQKNP